MTLPRDVAQPRFRSCPPQRRQGRRRPFHPDDDPLLCGLSHDRLQNILILRTLSPRPPHVRKGHRSPTREYGCRRTAQPARGRPSRRPADAMVPVAAPFERKAYGNVSR